LHFAATRIEAQPEELHCAACRYTHPHARTPGQPRRRKPLAQAAHRSRLLCPVLGQFSVDFSASLTDNQGMETTEKTTDKDALLEHIITGKPLDPEVRRRIRERGERITEQLRQTYGVMDIAVDLIRETRDES
jgi:hypothetical protein